MKNNKNLKYFIIIGICLIISLICIFLFIYQKKNTYKQKVDRIENDFTYQITDISDYTKTYLMSSKYIPEDIDFTVIEQDEYFSAEYVKADLKYGEGIYYLLIEKINDSYHYLFKNAITNEIISENQIVTDKNTGNLRIASPEEKIDLTTKLNDYRP